MSCRGFSCLPVGRSPSCSAWCYAPSPPSAPHSPRSLCPHNHRRHFSLKTVSQVSQITKQAVEKEVYLARARSASATRGGEGRLSKISVRGPYKPGSVLQPVSRKTSAAGAAIHLGGLLPGALKQPTRATGVKPTCQQAGASPLFGLAPGGVCHAGRCCQNPGALLPHPFTLACAPGSSPRPIGGLLSVALSL